MATRRPRLKTKPPPGPSLEDVVEAIVASVASVPHKFPLSTYQEPGEPCTHLLASVDIAARTLICASCKVPLDPFHVLQSVAKDSAWVERMRAEKVYLAAQIAAQRAELTRLEEEIARRAP